MNEAPFLMRWPNWKERSETLVEALSLMRKFWTSENYFDFEGKYFKVKGLFCYDKPKKPIPIYWSAFGPKSALLAGKDADHLMTGGASADKIPISIMREFERGLETTGKNPRKAERALSLDCGYGNPKKLLRKIRIYAGSMIPENTNEMDPRKIEASAMSLSDEFLLEKACLTDSPDTFIERIEGFEEAGFDHVIFGDWGYDPSATVKMFGRDIIPYFRKKSRK
jgi:alkanesulfonate monooxygenase SsuD/methylene tetrahydromethanopterin reductase-like flavin-dependent oxidoreductase (luciferase family)